MFLPRMQRAIESLKLVPDFLRQKLCQIVFKNRNMDAHFIELFVSGSPTEIRMNKTVRR